MGTYTFTATAPEDALISKAAGIALGLGQNANAPQSKQWLKSVIVREVSRTLDEAKRQEVIYDAPINPT